MIITIDGYRASGKTTQAKKLTEILGIPVFSRWYSLLHMKTAILNNANLKPRHLSKLFGTLQLLYAYPLKDGIIEDSFWTGLRDFKEEQLDGAIDLFMSALHLGGLSNRIISFLLDVPRFQAETRFYERVAEDRPLKPKNIELIADKLDLDKPHRLFWNSLAERVPFLHIIDGTAPIDEVTQTMMTIIKSTHG